MSLTVGQWQHLWRLHPGFFDVIADIVADINALMEEENPDPLFFVQYAPANAQTLRLMLHMGYVE